MTDLEVLKLAQKELLLAKKKQTFFGKYNPFLRDSDFASGLCPLLSKICTRAKSFSTCGSYSRLFEFMEAFYETAQHSTAVMLLPYSTLDTWWWKVGDIAPRLEVVSAVINLMESQTPVQTELVSTTRVVKSLRPLYVKALNSNLSFEEVGAEGLSKGLCLAFSIHRQKLFGSKVTPSLYASALFRRVVDEVGSKTHKGRLTPLMTEEDYTDQLRYRIYFIDNFWDPGAITTGILPYEEWLERQELV